MPKKQVVQYTCERCARVWYLDSDKPEPQLKLKLLLEITREKGGEEGAAIGYECLCDGCTDTVKSLVKSLAPLKPREKRAKKKDESAAKDESSTTNSTSSTSGAPAASERGPASVASPAPSAGAGSSAGAGPRATPSALPPPKRG